MTSFVNVESSNYKEGYDNNYYLNDGAVIPWYKLTFYLKIFNIKIKL